MANSLQVPVGMNPYYMHTDAEIYPEPFKFDPDRWLDNVTPEMKRNFVPFTRGSRSCPAMRQVVSPKQKIYDGRC